MIAFVGRHTVATAGLVLLAGTSPALAQTAAAPAPVTEEAVSERVKKDAASPLYWIRLNAQKADGATRAAAPRITEVRSAPAARPQAPPTAAVSAQAPSPRPSAGVATASPAPRREPEAEPTVASPSATLASPAPLASQAEVAAAAAAATTAAIALPSAASAPRPDQMPPPDDTEDPEPLSLLAATEPEFPSAMMRRLRKGTVQVRFEVQPDGHVGEVSVVQTSHRSLNAAAMQAVQAWQFKPVKAPRTAVVDLGFDLDG